MVSKYNFVAYCFNISEFFIEKKEYSLLKTDDSKYVIQLTIKQLVYIGLHIGHMMKNTNLFSSWVFYGWRSNLFIMDMMKTLLMSSLALKMVKKVMRFLRPFWFVTMNTAHGPYMGSYATVCGEPFNVFWWVSGSLTNLKLMMDWNLLLLSLYGMDKYLFSHQDSKKLMYYSGFKYQRLYAQSDYSDFISTLLRAKSMGTVSKKKVHLNFLKYSSQSNDFLNTPKYNMFKLDEFDFKQFKMKFRWFYFKFVEILWSKPGGGFVPTFFDNVKIMDEFAVSDLPFITLIDSNVSSGDMLFPIPSNDDSMQAIIFFTYLISKNIFLSKLLFLKKWKEDIWKSSSSKYLGYKYALFKHMESQESHKFINKNINELVHKVLIDGISKMNMHDSVKYRMYMKHETIFSSYRFYNKFKFFKLNFSVFKI